MTTKEMKNCFKTDGTGLFPCIRKTHKFLSRKRKCQCLYLNEKITIFLSNLNLLHSVFRINLLARIYFCS